MQITEETQEVQRDTSVRGRAVLVGAAVTVLCSLMFFSLYWNRFPGLRSGNGSFQGGMALLSGMRPYVDFYTAGPPFNMVISGAALGVFGPYLIVIRALGVFERLVLAVLLYTWLTRFFRPQHAAMASILAIVLSAGDPSSNLSSYGFEAVLFFLLSAFCAITALGRMQVSRPFVVFALAAGFFAGLSFMTKQTTGVGAITAIPFLSVLYLLWAKQGRRSVFFLACFAGGFCVSAGAIFLWLAKIGALRNFFTDAFKTGPAAKAARPSDYVVRAMHAVWHLRWGFIAGCLLLILSWRAMRKGAERPCVSCTTWSAPILWLVLLCAIAIGSAAALSYAGITLLTSAPSCAIYITFFGVAAFVSYFGWLLLRGRLSDREAKLCFLAGSCLVISVMIGLSWPASFDMVFPGLGLIAAAMLEGFGRLRRTITYAICALLLFGATSAKLQVPHGFHEWFDPPVREATAHSTLPELAGLHLPPDVVEFLDGTVKIVSEHSTADDTIFCYPEFGVIYRLAHRGFPTLSDSHNIDFVSDEFARAEAQRLLAKRPAVLIYYRIPAWSLRADEILWRRGKPSGQRDLINAMETLAKQYHLAAAYPIPPNEGPVLVYVRQ